MANNPINTVLMWAKRYLWSQKFTTKRLDLSSFQSSISHKVKLLMMVSQKRGNLSKFLERWGKIVDILGIVILPNFTIQ